MINAAVPHSNDSGDLLVVVDSKTGRSWLVDGGAFVSIRPPTPVERQRGPTAQKLQAANGTVGLRPFHSISRN